MPLANNPLAPKMTRDEIAEKARGITSVTFYNLASDEAYRQTCRVYLPCGCYTRGGGTFASIDANRVYKAVRNEDGLSLPLVFTKKCNGKPSRAPTKLFAPNHEPITYRITVKDTGERIPIGRGESLRLGRPRWREEWIISVELV